MENGMEWKIKMVRTQCFWILYRKIKKRYNFVVTYETPCGTLIRMRPPGVWIFKAVPGYTFGGHWTDISEWPGGADMMCY